jgi:hypothetical protein
LIQTRTRKWRPRQPRKREGKKRGKEGNGNSERPRGRERMKIDRLGMKGKEFLELALNIFKIVF